MNEEISLVNVGYAYELQIGDFMTELNDEEFEKLYALLFHEHYKKESKKR